MARGDEVTGGAGGGVPPVRLEGIGKAYSGTKVLEGVHVELRSGSVHALVGANGAGKSTLGRIIGGAIRPDEGQVVVDGRPVRFGSPLEARADGIALIAQELALVPQLPVMANVFLGIEPRRAGFVARRTLRRDFEALVARWGFELDGDVPVGSLRTADRQKVEILRAVASGARVIVMDEPTSSLTPVETGRLHEMVEALRREGRTIVYVSHSLSDVLEIADTVSVLRNGRLVRTSAAAGETEERLVAGMFGEAPAAVAVDRPASTGGGTVLEVVHLSRRGVLHDVSLSIGAGEILGVAGLVGSGRSELARAIAGVDVADQGTIVVGGEARTIRSPAEAIAAGIAFVPESRKDDGLFMDLSSAANTTIVGLREVARRGWLRRSAARATTRALLDALAVHPPLPGARVGRLSGGNQQKVLFARWLFVRPKVLVLDEPTRGVDVAARAAIHRLIVELAAGGAAVLLISSEIEEVLELAHRVIVLRQGAVVRSFGADPAMDEVMEAAFGLAGRAG